MNFVSVTLGSITPFRYSKVHWSELPVHDLVGDLARAVSVMVSESRDQCQSRSISDAFHRNLEEKKTDVTFDIY